MRVARYSRITRVITVSLLGASTKVPSVANSRQGHFAHRKYIGLPFLIRVLIGSWGIPFHMPSFSESHHHEQRNGSGLFLLLSAIPALFGFLGKT